MTKEVQRYSICLLSKDANLLAHLKDVFPPNYTITHTDQPAQLIPLLQETDATKTLVLLHAEILSSNGINLAGQIRRHTLERIPICLITANRSSNLLSIAQSAGIAEVFAYPLETESLLLRISFLIEHWPDLSGKMQEAVRFEYKTPLIKRLF